MLYPAAMGVPRYPNSGPVKTDSAQRPQTPTEDDVRDYAYHLYVQNGHRNDQCMDNWLEARACLEACIPKSESHIRLYRHFQAQKKPSADPGT